MCKIKVVIFLKICLSNTYDYFFIIKVNKKLI